jgi:hypothetical protein
MVEKILKDTYVNPKVGGNQQGGGSQDTGGGLEP